MVYGIDTAARGMIAQQLKLDVLANNLANVNTAGFKELIPVFQNLSEMQIKDKNTQEETPANSEKLIGSLSSGSILGATAIDMGQGALRKTDNKLDFAIDGEGFFSVQTQDGELYTRNGNFSLDDNGVLVTKNGDKVLDSTNKEITIDLTDKSFEKLTVRNDGTLLMDNQEIAKFKVVSFEKNTDVETIGNSLFKPVGSAKPKVVDNPKIEQGLIEGSNSNSIGCMINTITATRTYETLSKVLRQSDMTLGKCINEVGRVRD
jgi:flagellar basal-body rod protein FlgG